MQEITIIPQEEKMPRPKGVWLLTIYALIFTGIIPLLVSFYMLVSGNAAEYAISILLSIPVSLGVISGAIGAWKGNNKARIAFLVFITLHYGFIAVNNYTLIKSGQIPDDEQIRLWGRVLRGFLYPAVYIGYFSQKKIKDFYR